MPTDPLSERLRLAVVGRVRAVFYSSAFDEGPLGFSFIKVKREAGGEGGGSACAYVWWMGRGE